MKPVFVIANPNAAGGRGARVIPELESVLQRRGIDYELRTTEAPGHARAIAAERGATGPERILVVGGDGTIHEVAGGLLEAEGPTPEIAILPVGTGNDFHRMVRASSGVDEAVRVLEHGTSRRFEVGEVRWRGGRGHFVNLVGVGIDVEVLRRRERFGRLPGLLQYLGALTSALRHYEPVELTVRAVDADGRTTLVEAPILLSAVTVGPSVGGGFFLAPRATPDDGLLDLFTVRTLGFLKILRYLPGILGGREKERPEIWQRQSLEVEVRARSGQSFDFELDGELMDVSTDYLEIRVLPDSLRILDLPEGER